MSGAQSCPRGHRSGRIVTDGELVIQGQEHIRYRCVLPDGSFHRFMAVASRPAQLAPSPPAPVASGGGRHAGPRLDDSTAFLPSQRSRRIAPRATLPELSDLLTRHHIKRVPIVRDGRMVGIVSRADLVRAMSRLPANADAAA